MVLVKCASVLVLALMLRTASGRIDPRHRKPANYSDVLPIGRLLYKSPIIAFLYEPGMSVKEIRERESSTWHWYPWKHIQYDTLGEGELVERECVPDDSLDDLPEDLFTRNCNLIELRGLQSAHSLSRLSVFLSAEEQRQHGAVLLHFLGAIYFFTLLAVVCNDYFLPSVECICEDLQISEVNINHAYLRAIPNLS